MEFLKGLAEQIKNQETKEQESFTKAYQSTKKGFEFLALLLTSDDPSAIKVREALCRAMEGASRAEIDSVYADTNRERALAIDFKVANRGKKNQKLQAFVALYGYRGSGTPKVTVYPKNTAVKPEDLAKKMHRDLIVDVQELFTNPEAEEEKIEFVKAVGKTFSPAALKKYIKNFIFDP